MRNLYFILFIDFSLSFPNKNRKKKKTKNKNERLIPFSITRSEFTNVPLRSVTPFPIFHKIRKTKTQQQKNSVTFK